MSTVMAVSRHAWPFRGFLALLVITHFTLHLAIGVGEAAPDLLVIALLLAARQLSAGGAALAGFVLGVLEDALSLVAFGAAAITLTVLGYMAARSRELFLGDSLTFYGVYLFVGKWIHDTVYFLLARDAIQVDALPWLLIRAPLSALYASAVGVVVLLLYRWITGET